MNNTQETVRCSCCLRETSHAVLLEKKTTESSKQISSDPVIWAEYGYNYTLFECQGCHNVVLRKALWATDFSPDDYDPSYISWFPAIISRQIPQWHRQLPLKQADLLTQIYQALHAKSYSLVLMGLRAVLDMYIVDKIGDSGTFKEKLHKLKEEGHLSLLQLQQVEPALEAGSAAAHRGFEPSEEVVYFVLNVVESLLQQDVRQASIDAVKNATPKRPPR